MTIVPQSTLNRYTQLDSNEKKKKAIYTKTLINIHCFFMGYKHFHEIQKTNKGLKDSQIEFKNLKNV